MEKANEYNDENSVKTGLDKKCGQFNCFPSVKNKNYFFKFIIYYDLNLTFFNIYLKFKFK